MTGNVVTLIAETLDAELVSELRAALDRLGAEVGPPRWLAENVACDLDFIDLDPDQADAAARLVIGERAVDVLAQPAGGRRKRLLVADMESTLIENEMLDELADFVGLRAEIAAITARAMNGELDFEGAIVARVKLLAGLPVSTLETAAERITLMPGARALIATMRAAGARTVLVSGGFRFFTRIVAGQLGMDAEFANDLDIAQGKLAGTVAKPILGRQAKFDRLVQEAAAAALPLAATLSVGDGANDLDMILAAGLGIAYRAKPAVAARAQWRIEHSDLTALLYAQGYRADEILSG
ncbi:MAG TPA: phosphoserine phosphatase SerB [Aliidongia sp.]|nr:phosphoserine phosphatase SerB [Aliidongia sp.]